MISVTGIARKWLKWLYRLMHLSILIRNRKSSLFNKMMILNNRFILRHQRSLVNSYWAKITRHLATITIIMKAKLMLWILSSRTNPWAHQLIKTFSKVKRHLKRPTMMMISIMKNTRRHQNKTHNKRTRKIIRQLNLWFHS